ncbi:uncharacterized protein EDB91DRAFT_1081965 [Suillus paluster]|uniref:uncharacterized protein n=1 Tax=Suillus paluster TaxID=48578 RepID=UPI001B87EC08|nr:uncharacterized protein EDB91DRAFT_1081965 [Suillus paluster]KAG1740902.1 hypothetical protein EDB91DRAFT_1081965 [Suillus paluster]
MSSNSMSISTLDNDVLASIPKHHQFSSVLGLQYMDIAINKACYSECCQEAISRGFPMDGNYSIRPYMGVGVAIMSNAYAHLPDCAIRMWICLFTTISTSIDDLMERGEDLVHLYRFNERAIPVLNALNVLLWDIACLYAPPVLNLIVASSLNFMSSIVLDNETKDMQISAQTPLYPEYSRLLLGLADAYGFFIFPSTLPLQKYSIDILSYYKEEIEGDTANYLLLMAASRALTKQDALHEVIEKTVRAYHNVLEFLRPQTEAYEAYVQLEEIMWET